MDKEKLNGLVTKARNGDTDAMNDLILASYQDIYFYALKIVKKEHLAADATQDSCVEIIQTLPNLRESAAFVTWCRRIVYHQCTKRIGSSRMVPLEENEDGETILDRIPDEAPGSMPEEIMENRELRDTMLNMIDELPEGQRSALMLYYYERLSVKQIAEIQSENENTIKSRLYQGRKAVKKQVEAYEAKTGTRLHSVSILPLLYFLFHTGKEEADTAAAALVPQIQAAVAPAVAAATGTTGAAVGGTALASSVAAKIVAGALAVTVAAGAVAVGSHLSKQPSGDPEPTIVSTEPSASGDGSGHVHHFEEWVFNTDAHWQICECGAFSQESEHTYADGFCTVCYAFQPLPSSDLLTFDCTTLTGHWLNVSNDYEENLVEEFYISGDGSIDIQGVTYYPIGNDTSGPCINIYFRETPYDSDAELTLEEMIISPVTLGLNKTGDYYSAFLTIADTEEMQPIFSDTFYRESDYFGYEKVALTADNFDEYYTVTLEPIEVIYTGQNGGFLICQSIDFDLRDDLGYPSWCRGEWTVHQRLCNLYYNVETKTYEISPLDSSIMDESLNVCFVGYGPSWLASEFNGVAYPEDQIVTWSGSLPEGYTMVNVEGYVFVPKQ